MDEKTLDKTLFDCTDPGLVASELKARYEPLRAITLTARLIQKAIFAGRADDVVFWALVYAFYRGNGLNASTTEQLDAFRAQLIESVRQPPGERSANAARPLKRRSTRR